MTSVGCIRKRTRPKPVADAPAASTSEHQAGETDTYEVGYKKPPKNTQFQPGASGNPRGRPKGARNLKTELTEELDERIPIKEGGARRTVSKQRAAIKSLMAKAVQGDPRAANLLFNLVLKLIDQDEGTDQTAELDKDDIAILEAFEDRVRRRARKDKETKNV